MSTASLVQIENNKLDNIDINNIFEFSFKYNIDILKQAIEALIYNQKYTNMRLTNIEHTNINVQERLEKQELKHEILVEHINHIQNNNGEKEEFKKTLEDLKSHLNEIEKEKTEKIEEKAQKQREELHQNIHNIYHYHYPNRDENERKDAFIKKRFEKNEIEMKKMKKTLKRLKKKIKSLSNDEDDINLIGEDDNNGKKKRTESAGSKKSKKEGEEDKENEENVQIEGLKKSNEKVIINIFNRSKIGKKIKEIDTNMPEIIKIKDDIKDINTSLGQKDFNSSIKGLISKVEGLEKSFEDFSTKLNEFDIFAIFNGKDKGSGGNEIMDVIKALFQGFEKKYQNKFQNSDEKLKKIEEVTYKLKNEFSKHRLNNDKGRLPDELNLANLTDKIKDGIDNLSDPDNIKDFISNEISKLYNYINSKLDFSLDANLPLSPKLSDGDEEKDKDKNYADGNSEDKTYKRLNDLEKNFKIVYMYSYFYKGN